ncbi:tannase and feruloyl esterase [Hymenopellis radicata]|nr:tannase and feruloyl esterase [Hymenopellis radicata]
MALDCSSLKNMLTLANTTIYESSYVAATATISTLGVCQVNTTSTAAMCRVDATVNTSSTSAVHFEVWMPDEWYGRSLTVGNSGFAGCIDYTNLDYGAAMHFASIGTDAGHDGPTSDSFYENPEVTEDFVHRSLHVATVLGKQIIATYYGTNISNAYYIGCSTGGRQAHTMASRYPFDFNGIVGGSPATDSNRLCSYQGLAGRWVGAPFASESPKFITAPQWSAISQEIFSQCDALDGLIDGIIAEPDDCNPDFSSLACDARANATSCLTDAQLKVVHQIYSPLVGLKGETLFPRFDPGAEASDAWQALFSGDLNTYTEGYFQNMYYTDKYHNFDNFSLADLYYADIMDPFGISSYIGDLSPFKEQGGKYLAYHGRADPLINSGESKALYKHISSTMGLDPVAMDIFYRLFLVPGMGHCGGGVAGAPSLIGNAGLDTVGLNVSTHNVLLAIVDWVEAGNAPEVIVGLTENGTERDNCRYGTTGSWREGTWTCS